MRLGVMGGTFDPPHLGHLIVASEAHARLGLDRVLLVPAGDPWHKSTTRTPADHRLLMTRLAVAGDDRFEVSDVDVVRAGPTYTVDTLTQLRSQHDAEDEFVLLVGSDALQGIGSWHRARELPALARIVGLTRPGHPATVPGTWDQEVTMLQVPLIEISSTLCRERFRADLPMKYFVPDAVIDHALSAGLYGGPA